MSFPLVPRGTRLSHLSLALYPGVPGHRAHSPRRCANPKKDRYRPLLPETKVSSAVPAYGGEIPARFAAEEFCGESNGLKQVTLPQVALPQATG